MSKSLIDAFEVPKKPVKVKNISDYEVFSDKEMLDKLRSKIIQNLIDENIPDNKDLTQYINDEIDKSIVGYDLDYLQRSYIFNLIQNEINGNGPITELLEDDKITEIMVNGPSDIYVEIDGKIIKDDSVSFINDKHILRTIGRIVEPLGRTIDAANPMVDARLRDGSRLNAIIPPLSLTGPVLTIRKFAKNLETVDDLLMKGTLTNDMALFLEACVKAKLNILISGGTGTGKTTLLNILSSFIDSDERIITIEDAAELRLHQSHVISLETRLTNYEGEGEVTIRDLVRNSLRMRPDRIIVGEVRGKEAFDMMQAMNTGHEGSITTLHANNPIDALNRLETMILMNEMEIPVSAVRGYIENAIDIIIQIDRLTDGKRKVTSIGEVTSITNGNIDINPIFIYTQKGINEKEEVYGDFKQYKKTPKVYDKIRRKGIDTIDKMFNKEKQ
ncbi:MAG: CpaF family protein [Bacilli bacterium]|nr:CpaF family protein [Bacilli bacterium]